MYEDPPKKKRVRKPRPRKDTTSGPAPHTGRFNTKEELDAFVLHQHRFKGVSVSLIASGAQVGVSLVYKILKEKESTRPRMIHFVKQQPRTTPGAQGTSNG